MRRVLALVAVLLGLSGLAGCASGDPAAGLDGRTDDGYYGILLPKPYDVPRVPLTSADGAPYDVGDSAAPLTMVFFGYTHCPDVCGEVMASVASAMTRLDSAQRRQVEVVFVTTDPTRDTPGRLGDYLSHFDPAFGGLTGPIADIKRLGTALGVEIEKGRKLPGGGYDVTHGASVIGVDAEHQGRLVWSQATSSAQFAADVVKLLEKDAA